jgi:putative tryptophan/tyrosine transport system substrate-binding protein
MLDTTRRRFVTLLGVAAAAWPLTARAEPVGRIARVGVMAVARLSPETMPAYQAFFAELRAHGFIEGDNLVSLTRWIDEDVRGPSAVAAELVEAKVDVIVVEASEIGLKSAMAAAPHVPIVMYANNYDPIERGYVKSLRSPGGNITGVFTRQPELAEKQVELLTQAFPNAKRVAMFWNTESIEQFNAAQQRAKLLGLTVTSIELRRFPNDLDLAFDTVGASGAQVLHVLSSPVFARYRSRIIELAIRDRLPTMFIFKAYVAAGGLMSYGANRSANIRLLATYAAKILKGAKPADLPVEQPTQYELVINLKTAKAIGVEIPTALLLRADEVIE